MTIHRRRAARIVALSTCAVLQVGLAACASGGHAKPHSPAATSSAPVSQPATGPAAKAAVKDMWQTFFNGAVPIPRRLGLLQDGQQFAPFVRAQDKTSLGALVLAASAKVSAVALRPPGGASVRFSVLLAGKPVAKNLSGTAVYAGGRWLVAKTTFCNLLHVAYGKRSHVIPAACGSHG